MTKTPRCYDHRDNRTMPACNTCRRIAREQHQVRLVVSKLLEAGYALNVYNGGDTNELPAFTTDGKVILAAMMEADEDHLLARKAGERQAVVVLIYGNDTDLLSDWSTSIDALLQPALSYADAQAARL